MAISSVIIIVVASILSLVNFFMSLTKEEEIAKMVRSSRTDINTRTPTATILP